MQILESVYKFQQTFLYAQSLTSILYSSLYKRMNGVFRTYELRTFSVLNVCLAYVVCMVTIWVTYILYASIRW